MSDCAEKDQSRPTTYPVRQRAIDLSGHLRDLLQGSRETRLEMVVPQVAVAFHGIGLPDRELEPGEQRYWVDRDHFLRLLDLVAAEPNPARVLLTFDDANASDVTIALPALQERGLTASFFIITDRLDRPGSLSSEQLRILSQSMEIGSHGVSHQDWRKLDPRHLEVELVGSKQTLERKIGRTITAASIPFGRYDFRVLSALQRAGYLRIYSTDGGPGLPTDRPIPRTNVRAETMVREFADLIQGRETGKARLLRRLKALRRRLV
jgi:peptidoglycan/xylan/chitin deacetylase (PgdA/CDA1 family)